MKIDLHAHTITANKDEKKTRNIKDPYKFKKIMEEANIQIIAITNHNLFDIKQFNEFKSDNKSYLLLPGIEYDVDVSDDKEKIERRQINIIYNPDKIVEFCSKIKELNTDSKKIISVEKIIKKFDSDDTIFYFDYKKQKTSWNEKEYKKYLFDRNDKVKGVPIFDTQKISTHFILMANKFNSLIGSDLENWDEYVKKDSNDLVYSQMKFKSYELFVSVLKGKKDLEIVTQARQEIKINIDNKEKNIKLENIPLTNGINIIFGPKSTGKTSLLEEICFQYNSNNEIYESSEYKQKYEGIINETNHIDEFNEPINYLNNNILNISNYKEEHFSDFRKFYLYTQSPPKILIQLTKLKTVEFNQESKNEKILLLSSNYKKLIEDIKSNFQEDDDLLRRHLELYKDTSNWLKRQYLKTNKEYFSYKIKREIKSSIAKIIQTNKGQFTEPSSLGLISLFEKRQKLWESIENIKKMKKKYSKEIQEFKIPDGNLWILNQELNLFDPDNKNFIEGVKWNCTKWKGTKEHVKSGLQKLFEIDKYSDPRNYIDEANKLLNKEKSLYHLENKVFNKDSTNSKPSNGEMAYIALFNYLEKEKDTFFLDEPETYLGNKMISSALIDKLKDLIMNKKKIIMTTHVSSLGINTLPFNYIYRDTEKYDDDVYKTYVGNLNKDNELRCLRNEKKIDMIDTFIKHFEGNKDQFNFRKEIYETD